MTNRLPYDQDLDFRLHSVEAEHVANVHTRRADGIHRIVDHHLRGPVRDAALALEYWGPNYRDAEAILHRHLGAAIEEITDTLT